ncbi:MAG: ATP synthase F1 subunit delta [Melioribacteraceae bacterium]|nr:ATP synthase F1 subunit delta [Melioribacteraceae bacterium]
MSRFAVSTRYAVSLLDDSVKKNLLDKVSADIELVYSTFAGSKELRRVMANPIIRFEKKKNILSDLFSGKVSDEVMNFLFMILNKGREDFYFDITGRFIELKNRKEGIVNVLVKSAVELDNSQKEKIINKLEVFTNKKVKAEFKIDSSIIGGFIARIGDTVIDASIFHQLERLKNTFISESINLN